ncbi:MAG: hypothetical protein GDA49_09295 [Rhodospirillales bacterium]|nr:hypothetical protein [Rhodospirillales bacterium]
MPVRDRFARPDGTFTEYWSAKRRAMLTSCSERHFYMGLIARQDDSEGIAALIGVKTRGLKSKASVNRSAGAGTSTIGSDGTFSVEHRYGPSQVISTSLGPLPRPVCRE